MEIVFLNPPLELVEEVSVSLIEILFLLSVVLPRLQELMQVELILLECLALWSHDFFANCYNTCTCLSGTYFNEEA